MLFKELKNLKLDLKSSFIMPEPADGKYQLTPYRVEEVLGKDSLIQFMNLGLYWHLREVQIFTTIGNYTGVIHIDGNDSSATEGAINWVVNDTDSSDWTTQWFDVINPNNAVVTKEARIPGSAVFFEPKDCKVIEEWKSPSLYPTLLHVGVPHRIVNNSSKTRYCISVRFNIETQNFFTLSNILS